MKTLNKLGRNKIPAILEKKGEHAITRILFSDAEYTAALYTKLQEEVAEFLETPVAEELADILEVVHALAPLVAGSFEELEKVRLAKAEARGGFDGRIFIEKIHRKF
ncbi:phosphoribosyl-ATP pyrophosphohydrolase [Candidatus Dependentiae bacterium HGW-Dependentiae-1]|nr:MAG: phosphoribosyl-ATP pyrophosphohydrolase [Candidatus Dependentiae bacterium HGW-Dependentiae-1]